MLRTATVPQIYHDVKISVVSDANFTQSAPAFPAHLALDINDVLSICEEKAECAYRVATQSYIIAHNGDASQRYRAEYTTLVPYSETAPKFVLERNMYGFYVIDLATGLIDRQKHTAFTRLIDSRNAPVVTASPSIINSQKVHHSTNDFRYELHADGFESVVKLTTAPDGSLLESPVSPAQEAHIIKIMNVQPIPAQQGVDVVLVASNDAVLVKAEDGWKAESKSNPGQTHTTSHDGSSCTCNGFNGRYNKCWHTATVRDYVARQVSAQRRKDRANALPVMRPRRRGLSKMFK